MLFAPYRRAASNVRSTSAATTMRWKLAHTSAISCSDNGRLAAADVSQCRRFQPAEAEIQIALQAWRVSIGVRQPRRRQCDRPVVPVTREAVDDRPPGITEAEKLRQLVVGFSCRIVARAAEQIVAPRMLDEIQARMSA
jgi:hypothetical protein